MNAYSSYRALIFVRVDKFPNSNVLLNFREQFSSCPINGTCAYNPSLHRRKEPYRMPVNFRRIRTPRNRSNPPDKEINRSTIFLLFFLVLYASPSPMALAMLITHDFFLPSSPGAFSSRLVSSCLARSTAKARVALERKSRRATRESS